MSSVVDSSTMRRFGLLNCVRNAATWVLNDDLRFLGPQDRGGDVVGAWLRWCAAGISHDWGWMGDVVVEELAVRRYKRPRRGRASESWGDGPTKPNSFTTRGGYVFRRVLLFSSFFIAIIQQLFIHFTSPRQHQGPALLQESHQQSPGLAAQIPHIYLGRRNIVPLAHCSSQ